MAPPVPGRHHVTGRRLGAEKDALEVGVHDQVPVLDTHLGYRWPADRCRRY